MLDGEQVVHRLLLVQAALDVLKNGERFDMRSTDCCLLGSVRKKYPNRYVQYACALFDPSVVSRLYGIPRRIADEVFYLNHRPFHDVHNVDLHLRRAQQAFIQYN